MRNKYNVVIGWVRIIGKIHQAISLKKGYVGQYNEANDITVDKDGTSALEIFVGTYEGRYYKSKNTINLIWSDGTYLFNMIAPDTFEIGELVRLAENLQEK